jgi:purine-nucleoside phosphorylase
VARSVDATLEDGVYVQFRGPHYETPAEVQMAKAIGGHVVGMSTALEAIAARQVGMEVLGLSLVTNLAAGIQKLRSATKKLLTRGARQRLRISALLAQIVAKL